jgi:hypothetical protein
MNAQLALPLCQRWHRKRDSYRPPDEPIDTRRHAVDLLDRTDAKAFVLEHHYSHSFPPAAFVAGLYRTRAFHRAQLVGVAVFGPPSHQGIIPRWTNLPAERGTVLLRFVLAEDVPGNGETYTLGGAWAALRRAHPELEAVLAYSDPVARLGPTGHVVKRGHIGRIYGSHNGYYLGRSRAQTLILGPGGVTVNARSLSKLRNDERGRDSVEAELRRLGAPPRRPHESGAAYADRALREGPFRRVPHPGCHVYAWPLRRNRELRASLSARALPRPTRPDPLTL